MARPVSWLPRLPVLLRSVSESVRSHYASGDLERLFEIQPRAAQMLMGLLPTMRIGKSLLVEREVLAGLLARLADAGDPAAELAALRARGKPPTVRRRLRDLVPRDIDAGLVELPDNVALEPGSLTVRFATVEELASSLWRLAALLQEDLDGFAARYEPAREADADAGETGEDEMERAHAAFIREGLANQ
jgi:hypothetical protein